MRIMCLCNNWLGWQVLLWLANRGQEIAGLVVHPAGQGRCLDEIRSVVEKTGCVIVDDSFLSTPEGLAQLRDCKADMAVSVLFRNILRKPFLDLFPKGCINLHPAYLPYNRGNYPNVWSIVEKTPAGVTLHYIDEGLDTGDIIAQEKVVVDITDTGGTLYRKLEIAALELFQRAWPGIELGNAPRKPQGAEPGTSHRRADVGAIDEIDLQRMYRAEDLINLLRARTFPPYRGAYFRHDSKKIYLSLELSEGPASVGGQARDQRMEGLGSGASRDDKPGNSD
jgi:methionyl-tRNA formyltransferase